jgi:hypothetical protein
MKARVTFSALAVIVTLGILGMHAAVFGHGPMTAMADLVDMVHEPSAHAGAIITLEAPEPTGDGHAGFLSTLCVAILSIALSFTAVRVALRARASSRRRLHSRTWLLMRVTRTRAGPPPPLLVPLRS